MEFEQMTYAQCKPLVARMAGLVAKANTAQELAAFLLADTQAPYHTFDPLAYPTIMANLADHIGMLLCDDMDDDQEEPA